jgi:hypothetical protein
MGNCTSCRQTMIDVIPDRDVMLQIVEQIVTFEEMLKRGESLSKEEKHTLKSLKPVAREFSKVSGKRSDLLTK